MAKNPSNPELKQARSELESTITELSADLDDLVESVRAIEQDPYRFGLELEEVQRRRKLVDDVGAEVEKMRLELQQTVNHSAETALPNPTEFDVALEEEERERQQRGGGGRDDEDYYASMEQQRQTELMHEQDEQLDGVFRTVGNLREQASHMGRELEDQAIMLEEVDTLAERVGGKLSSGMKRIRHVVRENEGKFDRVYFYFYCRSTVLQDTLACSGNGLNGVGIMNSKLTFFYLDTWSSFCIAALIFALILLLILVIIL